MLRVVNTSLRDAILQTQLESFQAVLTGEVVHVRGCFPPLPSNHSRITKKKTKFSRDWIVTSGWQCAGLQSRGDQVVGGRG